MINVKFITKFILKFTLNPEGTNLTAAVPWLDAAPLPDARSLGLLLHEVGVRHLSVDEEGCGKCGRGKAWD